MERRLSIILAADVVGYSRLMEGDEERTLDRLKVYRQCIDLLIEQHDGRVFASAGDSILAEFASPVKALRAAIDIQRKLEESNLALREEDRMEFRIGVNLGDIIVEGDNLLGDGVNIAARLEALAPPGGICISKPVFEQVAGKLEASFASAGRHRVKNISKPLEVWVWPPQKAQGQNRPARLRSLIIAGVALTGLAAGLLYFQFDLRSGSELPSNAKIVLIPFKNIGGDPEDAFFSDGLSRDINAYLSKFSNLFVIAPAAGQKYREDVDCALIRKDLGADYILSGAVRRSEDRIRVTTEFSDTHTCRQLDSPGPFDRDLSVSGILDIQLEIAQKVASAIGSADAPLFNAEVQRAIRRDAPDNLEAYECVLLSYWFYETFERERHVKARKCLENAVEIDPDYSLGWSRLAFSYIESKKYAIDTPENWARLSRTAADKAIELDPDNPDAYYALAILSQMLGEERSVFRNFAERAIALNPNDSFVLADLGTWIAYTGAWERGKELVMRAKLLNPNHQSWWDWIWCLHHFAEGEYKKASDVALKINLPNNYMIQAVLTASYGMHGEKKKAEEALAHLLEIRPDFAEAPRVPFETRGMQKELIDAIEKGLKRAGLEIAPQK